MAKPTVEDHTLMSLAIKRKGKFVDLEHIREKVSRDAGWNLTEDDAKKVLLSLVRDGLLEEKDGNYAITDAGREYFEKRWREIAKGLNQDYLKVYRAKAYYPKVMTAVLEFCKDRYVSVFRLFTGRGWLQRKLGPRWITIKSERDVQYWLDVHGIDFIPYIHRIGYDRPDWLVIDFDAGSEVEFSETKKVVLAVADVLGDYGIKPAVKFSGSRGFQVWAQFKPHELPNDYQPKKLKTEKRERNFFTFYSDIVRFVESRVSKKLPGLTTAETAKKEARKDKVLLDASIIKPMGDVRAPYSMHYKTGRISVPVPLDEIKDFTPEKADPDLVAERYRKMGNEFKLVAMDGSRLFDDVVAWCRS
ncbi:MAG: hypothetical protein ACK4GQ_01595 [Candidatus Hadarchaeales archaeon]